MADDLVIPSGWLESVTSLLNGVRSVGQAKAAIAAALEFGRDVYGQLDRSWWEWITSSEPADPWRDGAQKQVDDAVKQVEGIAGAYISGDETKPVGGDWAKRDRGMVANLFSLAKVVSEGYPKDEDAGGLADILLAAPGNLAAAIAAAPQAILATAGGIASTAIGTVVGVARGAVKGAADIVGDAAKGVHDAVESLIPWKVVIPALLIVGLGAAGYIYAAKRGLVPK